MQGNNRKYNNERCVIHLFQYNGCQVGENLQMERLSNCVTGALLGTKAKCMGHNQPFTAFHLKADIFSRISSQNTHTYDIWQRPLLTCTKPRSHNWCTWQTCIVCHVVGTVYLYKYRSVVVSHRLSVHVTQVTHHVYADKCCVPITLLYLTRRKMACVDNQYHSVGLRQSDQIHESWRSYHNDQASIWQVACSVLVIRDLEGI
jgi:hypothetical protein